MEIVIREHDKSKVLSNKTTLSQRPIAVTRQTEQGKQQQKKAGKRKEQEKEKLSNKCQ